MGMPQTGSLIPSINDLVRKKSGVWCSTALVRWEDACALISFKKQGAFYSICILFYVYIFPHIHWLSLLLSIFFLPVSHDGSFNIIGSSCLWLLCNSGNGMGKCGLVWTFYQPVRQYGHVHYSLKSSTSGINITQPQTQENCKWSRKIVSKKGNTLTKSFFLER